MPVAQRQLPCAAPDCLVSRLSKLFHELFSQDLVDAAVIATSTYHAASRRLKAEYEALMERYRGAAKALGLETVHAPTGNQRFPTGAGCAEGGDSGKSSDVQEWLGGCRTDVFMQLDDVAKSLKVGVRTDLHPFLQAASHVGPALYSRSWQQSKARGCICT